MDCEIYNKQTAFIVQLLDFFGLLHFSFLNSLCQPSVRFLCDVLPFLCYVIF